MTQIKTAFIEDLAITEDKLAATAVTNGKLSAAAVNAAKVDLTDGFSWTGLHSFTTRPTFGGSGLATQDEVTAATQGLDVKESCRAATTGPVGGTWNATGGAGSAGQWTGAPGTVDGVTLVAGDRVLVLNESSNKERHGIFVVTATTTTWDRASDANTSDKVTTGMYTFVSEGTTNGNTAFIVTTNDPITLNTTPFDFTVFSNTGGITAGDGLTGTTTFAVQPDSTTGAGTLPPSVGANGVGVPYNTTRLQNNAGDLDIADGGIGLTQIADDGVDENKIVSTAFGSAMTGGSGTQINVADNGITSAKINNGAVDENKIVSTTFDGTTISGGSGSTVGIAAGGVDTTQLANDAVDATKIADGAVGSAAIATGAVDTTELADDAVDASKLADGAVSYPALADEYKAAGLALLSANFLGNGPASTFSAGLSGYAVGSTFLITGTGGTVGGTSFAIGDVGMVTSSTTAIKITDLTEQPKFIVITTDTIGGSTATEIVYEVKSDGGTGATYTVVINPASDETTNINAVVVGVDNGLSEADEKLLEIGRTLTFDPSTDNWRTIRQIYAGSNIEIDNDGTINSTSEPAIADVNVMTIEPLPAYTYNSTAGTLTANANGALPDVDNASLSVNDKLLVIEAGTGDVAFGIYEVTDLGDASNPWVLTRTTLEEGDTVNPGYNVFVKFGRAGGGRTFYVSSGGTVGTNALYFVEDTPTGEIPVQDIVWFVGTVAQFNTQTFADIPEFVAAIIKDAGTITIGATNFSASANTLVYRVGDEITGEDQIADGRYITNDTFGNAGDISAYMPSTIFVYYDDTGVDKDRWAADSDFRHLAVSGGYFQGQTLARTGDGTIGMNSRARIANGVIKVSNIERDAVTLPVTAPSGFSNSDLFIAVGQASDKNFIAYYGDSFVSFYHREMYAIRPGDVIAVESTGEFLLVTEAYGGTYDGSNGTLKFTALKPADDTVTPKAQTELSAYTVQYSFTAGTNTGTYNATNGEDGVGQIAAIADSELSSEAPTPQIGDIVLVANRTSGQNGIYKITARPSGSTSDADRIDLKLNNGAQITDTSKNEVFTAVLDTNRIAVWGTDNLEAFAVKQVVNKHTLTSGEITTGGFNLTDDGAPTPDIDTDPCFKLVPLGGVEQERGVDFEVSQISGGTNADDYFISFDSATSEPGGGTITNPSGSIKSLLTAGDKIVNCYRSRFVAIS